MSQEYKEQQKFKDTEMTRQLLKQLPPFCTDYYIGRKIRLLPKSQLNYARKMSVFLEYLHQNNSYFQKKTVKEITLEDLALLKPSDAREFVAWVLEQEAKPNSMRLNKTSTAENYIACLSSYWTYFCREEALSSNPFLAIDREKRKKKEVIYLAEDQKDAFKSVVSYGEGLTKKQLEFQQKNLLREVCICQVLLDTGIRVSELVGLNIEDVDLKNCKLNVQRKGDKPDVVYFSDETRHVLGEYLDFRNMYHPGKSQEAVFLVATGKFQGQRLGVRSVERLVKKYALAAHIPQAREITPHKLRSTFAMDMLRETGNIALVKEQLGHESISTTQIYARAENRDKEENRNRLMDRENTKS